MNFKSEKEFSHVKAINKWHNVSSGNWKKHPN